MIALLLSLALAQDCPTELEASTKALESAASNLEVAAASLEAQEVEIHDLDDEIDTLDADLDDAEELLILLHEAGSGAAGAIAAVSPSVEVPSR